MAWCDDVTASVEGVRLRSCDHIVPAGRRSGIPSRAALEADRRHDDEVAAAVEHDRVAVLWDLGAPELARGPGREVGGDVEPGRFRGAVRQRVQDEDSLHAGVFRAGGKRFRAGPPGGSFRRLRPAGVRLRVRIRGRPWPYRCAAKAASPPYLELSRRPARRWAGLRP